MQQQIVWSLMLLLERLVAVVTCVMYIYYGNKKLWKPWILNSYTDICLTVALQYTRIFFIFFREALFRVIIYIPIILWFDSSFNAIHWTGSISLNRLSLKPPFRPWLLHCFPAILCYSWSAHLHSPNSKHIYLADYSSRWGCWRFGAWVVAHRYPLLLILASGIPDTSGESATTRHKGDFGRS